ncbi:MAG: hypothetical protein U9Q30_08130 [Campylobacterota bacterium]|nr:hypothetical protein [Campylobacterota bacterium]
MTYSEIFILGWNLNAMMFVINLLLAFFIIKKKNPQELEKESRTLRKLKVEFDNYYPNRKYETMLSYAIPFTAFLRISFKLVEMISFFSRNKDTHIYDFMIYKYQSDINKMKK